MTDAKQDEEGKKRPGIRVRLKPNRERPVLRGSAWIFSGALDEVDGEGPVGSPVDVYDFEGDWLAQGLWHPDAEMPVRVLTRNHEEILDEAFFRDRIRRAVSMRHRLFGPPEDWKQTNAYRMIFSEADGLSGLIADQYAGAVLLQVGSKVWEPWLPALVDELKSATGADCVVVRAEAEAVKREGLSPELGGEEPPESLIIRENGFQFGVGLSSGQKTGFYLDQRENRRKVAAYAKGREMLSAYCYSGAFEVCAAHAGAVSITGWDSSEPAIDQARRHHELNPSDVPVAYEVADVPNRLREARDRGEQWDLIVLDPPRLVMSRSGLERGLSAYKDVNLLAIKLLRPGGILATFSCSGLVSLEEFRRTIGWAAHDAGRRVRILEILGQPADHPIPIESPECEYLKGLICVVDE